MPGRSPKDKGAGYEREVSTYLTSALGIPVARSILTQQLFNKRQGNSDLIGLPGISPELKRTEALNVRSALRQAATNVSPSTVPAVITRRNRESTGQSMVVLHLDDFLTFYRAWLKQEGFIK